MRTLTADEVARLRAARAEGVRWGRIARALTANDHAAGLLPAGQCWTARTVQWVAEHPAPVRFVSAGGAR